MHCKKSEANNAYKFLTQKDNGCNQLSSRINPYDFEITLNITLTYQESCFENTLDPVLFSQEIVKKDSFNNVVLDDNGVIFKKRVFKDINIIENSLTRTKDNKLVIGTLSVNDPTSVFSLIINLVLGGY